MAKITINISEYEWCNWDNNTKIKYILSRYKKLGIKVASKYTILDAATRESIVYESALDVCNIIIKDYKKFDDIKNLYCTIIRNKCNTEADYVNAKKRGGKVITYSLEEQYKEEEYTDTNILDIETTLYLQQLKKQLTSKEYKFVQMVIQEPHLLSNIEYANIMGVSEGTIRRIKKTLQTKIFNE